MGMTVLPFQVEESPPPESHIHTDTAARYCFLELIGCHGDLDLRCDPGIRY